MDTRPGPVSLVSVVLLHGARNHRHQLIKSCEILVRSYDREAITSQDVPFMTAILLHVPHSRRNSKFFHSRLIALTAGLRSKRRSQVSSSICLSGRIKGNRFEGRGSLSSCRLKGSHRLHTSPPGWASIGYRNGLQCQLAEQQL